MALTNSQQEILSRVLEQHSLVVLGQSGTGKSYLIKEIAKQLKKCGKSVQITATTGIASLNIGGKTIHSWSGIGDGRYTNNTLLNKLENNEHYQVYKNNIKSTDCLIIDEISMLSMKLFEQLEFVCRNIANKHMLFGGIQVIAVGDFFQLPPVPDNLKLDPGEYCFKSSLFCKIFCHKFILYEVMRQHQPDFIKAINDVARGDMPEDTLNLLTRLKRPLPPGDEPIRLCARNFDCFIYNACRLMDLEDDETVYNAIDEGNVTKLEKNPAPNELHLKVGCPVMLLKNLSEKLVNGLRGTVQTLNKDSVIVQFTSMNSEPHTVELKPEPFTVFSSLDNKVIATRRQIPICLAFSVTIHKAQGLTLQRVEVDASCIFAPGQLGVAIGRATEKKRVTSDWI